LNSELPAIATSDGSEDTFMAEWRARNDDSAAGDTSSTSSPPPNEKHAPLFPHFWSREHQNSPPAVYTYDPKKALTLDDELVKFELDEFVRSFELEACKPHWIKTRMVIRGGDIDHRRRIFGG